jgi:hypothetical protein
MAVKGRLRAREIMLTVRSAAAWRSLDLLGTDVCSPPGAELLPIGIVAAGQQMGDDRGLFFWC